MNGLKYIRVRCNLSLNDLAECIGVTRQALSAWENGKKEIPEQRKEQLSEFFGIDQRYFGEISEEEKITLLEKAMFRYDHNGRESYRYKPQDKDGKNQHIYFLPDTRISMDEKYVLAQKRKQEILEKADDIIKWTDHAGSIASQIACINRGCSIYGMTNDLMEMMRNMEKMILKMPFYYELMSVWKAMLLAYGLMEQEEISGGAPSEAHWGEDPEWIIRLAEEIREHWDAERSYHENCEEERRKQQRKEKENKEQLKGKDQITRAEEQNRQFREKCSESGKEAVLVSSASDHHD